MLEPPEDKPVFYAIEAPHLADLEAVARRLYAAPILDDAECHDAAMKIMSVVNYAKTLAALRGAKPEGIYVHTTPKKELTQEELDKIVEKTGQSPEAVRAAWLVLNGNQ